MTGATLPESPWLAWGVVGLGLLLLGTSPAVPVWVGIGLASVAFTAGAVAGVSES